MNGLSMSAATAGRGGMRALVAAALGSAALVTSVPAFAQAASASAASEGAVQSGTDLTRGGVSNGSEADIVVTARKREETLIDVPVAVSALTAAGIARYAATDLSRIADNIPTVQITRASSGTGATLVIRGISSTFTDAGLESAVSLSIDGVPLSRGYIVNAAFFDLQQVEVLKGPQALFFGKNSPAGVISLKSVGPGNEFSGYVKGGYEFRAEERYIEGAVGGPITENLGVRIALRGSKMDGWIKNNAGPLANPNEPAFPLPGSINNKLTPNGKSLAGRLTVEYRPTDDFTAIVKVLHTDYRDNDAAALQQVVACNAANGRPSTLGRIDPYGDCKPDNQRSSGNLPLAISAVYPLMKNGEYRTKSIASLASLNLNYDLGDISLSSVSGIYDADYLGIGNFDYTVFAVFPGANGEISRHYTNEVRLTSSYDTPVNFMIGTYAESFKRRNYNFGRGGFGFPIPFDPNFGGASIAYAPDDTVSGRTYSAFGQVTWDITDTLQASGGVRYTNEKKRARIEDIYVGNVPLKAALSPVGRTLRGRFADSNWSPEATLTWHPAPQQTLYIAYKTGYKSGGFSTTGVLTAAQTIEALTFDSETAKGGEIGYKAALFDRRLTITSALYNYKFDNLQRSSLLTGTTAFVVRNAAAARSRGVEGEVNFQASEGFNLRAAAAYNRAKFLAYPAAPCYTGQTFALGCTGGTINPVTGNGSAQNLGGFVISLAPKFSASGGFTFDTPVNSGIALGLTGDVRYVSKYRTQDDGIPNAVQKGYAKFNGSIRLHEADDRWELSLIGLNVFNKYAILFTSSKPGGASGDLSGPVERGREVRVQAGYRF